MKAVNLAQNTPGADVTCIQNPTFSTGQYLDLFELAYRRA